MPQDFDFASRYLERNGLDGVDRTISGNDEMFSYLASHGDQSSAELSYFRGGFEVLRSVENILNRSGRPISGCDRFLDFACGWGRLTRHLTRVLAHERVWASDIEADAIAYVAKQFGVSTFLSTRDPAALGMAEKFDVIYVGSLFSHLPEATFRSWLSRLWMLVADDGLLLFSTHGAKANPSTPRDASGFTFLQQSETKGRLDTAAYGTTMVDEASVRKIAREQGLPELGWLEAELWGIQDLWVARRSSDPMPVLEPASTPVGRILKAWFPKPGHAWVGGGVRLPLREGKPEIRLWIDGEDTADCVVSEAYSYPHEGALCPALQYFEWYTEGPLECPPGTTREIAVAAKGASGTSMVFDVGPVFPDS